jgi:hypothetical protein
MPVVESSVIVPVPVDVAFAVSQTTGTVRMRWDPFIRSQRFLGGATSPATGVKTLTVHRLGFRMVSEYVSYHPPSGSGASCSSATSTVGSRASPADAPTPSFSRLRATPSGSLLDTHPCATLWL